MYSLLFISALIVGLSLGLLGAGGSILTVPALMLILGMEEKAAIASSLAIVSVIAFSSIFSSLKAKLLQFKVLLIFMLASLPAASAGAYLGTLLPNGIQTLLLSCIMLIAAYKMFYSNAVSSTQVSHPVKLTLAALMTGLVTGLVGIGGGFLLVPALVIYAGLSMQQAVANSLILIAVNGMTAFSTLYFSPNMPVVDLSVIVVMAAVGMLAVIVGQHFATKLNQTLLKRAFAALLVLVSLGLVINLGLNYFN
ncbi:sulfite exporter TauE/SafE family protein [Paraglaciecola aestuariivivens]